MSPIRWQSYAVKKGGEKVRWQRRKRAKTTNNLIICDNKHHILAISDCISGNHHDSYELIEQMTILLNKMDEAKIDYKSSHLNADSGFDVKSFIEYIEQKHQLIANIPKNQRNTKKINQEHRYLSEYIYSFRFKIETIFAWLDSYKRILIRFEQRAKHFKSWLLIASFLINSAPFIFGIRKSVITPQIV